MSVICDLYNAFLKNQSTTKTTVFESIQALTASSAQLCCFFALVAQLRVYFLMEHWNYSCCTL